MQIVVRWGFPASVHLSPVHHHVGVSPDGRRVVCVVEQAQTEVPHERAPSRPGRLGRNDVISLRSSSHLPYTTSSVIG